MKSIAFPTRAEDLGADLITRLMSQRHPGVRVDGVAVLDQAHCDSGSASTAARAVLALDYGEGGQELPRRMILKTVLIRPGSIADLYENEVRFYRQLRDEVPIETPRCFGAAFDEGSGSFGILMEDVSLRGARFPSALEAMNLDQIRNLLAGFAAMHARFWQSPRFQSDLAWMWTPLSGGFHDFLQSPSGLEFFRGLMAQCEYKVELLERLGKTLEQMWELLWKAQAVLASEPTTLLHGDTHLGNTYLLPDNRVGMLDWQLIARGRWSHDVTYMLMTALDVETRRSHDRELIGFYLDKLREHGVDAPSLEDAWELYRRTAIWGFMLGWFICPVENYGEDILRANLDRLAATLEDVETFAALDAV